MRSFFAFVVMLCFVLPLITSCKSGKPLIISQPVEIRQIDTVYVSANDDSTVPAISERKYNHTYERTFDLLHTALDIRFDWKEEIVIGTAELLLTPLIYEQDTIILDAKDFVINSISLVDKTLEHIPLSYNYNGKQVHIALHRSISRKDSVQLHIDYTAKPKAGEATNSHFAISSDKGLFFIDPRNTDPHKPTQIWTQGETENNSKWFPTIDKPNERCTQRLRITIPDSFVSLSNGLLVSSNQLDHGFRVDTWELNQPHAPYLFMMAIGAYHIAKREHEGMSVDYYVEPEYAHDADVIFGHTPEMISFFSELLEYPFPWPKYAQIVVRDYISGAMENTSASVFGQSVQKPAGDLIDHGNDNIIAHELFHQWFGNLVTCESWANLTLQEGFANYSEYLWRAHKYGPDDADYHRMNELAGYLDEALHLVHPLIDYHYAEKGQMFDAHSYNKGGLVLHMLRDYLGDMVFFEGLRHYLRKKAFSSVEVHDLRLSFEAVSGKDLNWFFNQWFLSSGHPIIQQHWTYNDGLKSLSINIDQQQSGAGVPDVFTFPLEIDLIYSSGRVIRKSIWIDERNTTVSFPNEKPIMLVLDPRRVLLLEVSPDDVISAELLYKSSSSIETRLLALNSSTAPNLLFEQALEDPFWAVRHLALQRLYESGSISKKQLLSISKVDSHAAVRALALSLLRYENIEIPPEDIISIYNKDKSNLVKKEAFLLINQLDKMVASELATSLSVSLSPALLEGLGEYYLLNDIKGKDEFFEKASHLSSYETYFTLFPLWGSYIGNQEFENIEKRLEKWERLLNDSELNSYYGLAILTGIDALVNTSQQTALSSAEKQAVLNKSIKIYQSSAHILSKFGY